jgi:hypothetical protein
MSRRNGRTGPFRVNGSGTSIAASIAVSGSSPSHTGAMILEPKLTARQPITKHDLPLRQARPLLHGRRTFLEVGAAEVRLHIVVEKPRRWHRYGHPEADARVFWTRCGIRAAWDTKPCPPGLRLPDCETCK